MTHSLFQLSITNFLIQPLKVNDIIYIGISRPTYTVVHPNFGAFTWRMYYHRTWERGKDGKREMCTLQK